MVDLLAQRAGGRLRPERGLHARAATVQLAGRRALLAVPTTYMNDSGAAAAPLLRRGGGAPLLVVHDELDLPAGRIKVKVGGGNAGHNGLRSIDRALRTRDYTRVRIGIGKPPGRLDGADYVLSRPGARDREALAVARGEAADAVETVLADGVDAAMQRFNGAPAG